jgi:hydrogenase maturation factor
MFVDNAVVKKFEGEERYDRFAIAGTLFDVSFKGAACSVIESKILKNCEGCNLKYLCQKIDEVVEDYKEKTTVVTDSFSFGN